ncbi:MAG: HutD family protein [Pseudomonadota bacterium]
MSASTAICPMSWQLVHLADVSATPWRNGGGVTRELVAWPDARDWAWRMSVAEVASDGPFSRFDSVARWFAVLGGAGVRLTVDGRTDTLTRDSAPFAFDGGAAVDCRLVDGATQDFNLMTRSGTATMRRLDGVLARHVHAGRTVALYSGASEARVDIDGVRLDLPPHCLAWRVLQARSELRLNGHGALWMEITP